MTRWWSGAPGATVGNNADQGAAYVFSNLSTPTITWNTPAAITYGTALGNTQLDATASVAGTFTYTPTIGTVLPGGKQTLSVTFTPDDTTDYTTATASVAIRVNPATPTITWNTPTAITYGTALGNTQLDATASVAGTFRYTPALGTVLSGGNQTLSTTFTPTDTTDYTSAMASVAIRVNQATTTTSVTVSPNPSVYGQSVTLTATVSATTPGAGVPTGAVTFIEGLANPPLEIVLGTGTLNVSGVASFTMSALPVGTDTITASYGGNTDFGSSSLTGVSEIVTQAATSTKLTASANPALLGATVIFTVTVSAAAPGTGTPTELVGFLDGNKGLGTATLDGDVATFSTSNLTLGSHPITAFYFGDANFQSSSGILTEQIDRPVATTTTIVASANPVGFGQPVTLTATVKTKSGALTGTVVFMDGNTPLGTGTPTGGGKYNFTTSALSVGTHAITATYVGDSVHDTSTSAKLAETIKHAATVSLGSSSNPSTAGKLVTFTATVSGGSGMPSGSLAFKNGTRTLGTVKLRNGLAIFKTSTLALGGHTITAIYSGNRTYAPTSTTITQTVNPKPSRASPIAMPGNPAASPTTAQSLDAASTNGLTIDAVLRALLLDESTVTGKPRPLFEP